MSQHLPTGNFQIYENYSKTESFVDRILITHACSNTGYIIIVGLKYPDSGEDRKKNFAICPGIKTIYPKVFLKIGKNAFPNHIYLPVK